MKKGIGERIIHHILTIVFLIGAVLFSIFRFQDVFWRTFQALIDLKNSLLYYVLFIFRLEDLVPVTVIEISQGMVTMLPLTPDEFLVFWDRFIERLFSWENFQAYFEWLMDELQPIAETLAYLLIPLVAFVAILFFYYAKVDKKQEKKAEEKPKQKEKVKKSGKAPKRKPRENGKRAEREEELLDSAPLQWWKRNLEGRISAPIRRAVREYHRFFWEHKLYYWAMILIWTYNLNILTILIEAVAWIFYVAMSIDYVTILIQIAKLAIDLTVVIGFFPWWAWLIIGYIVFDWIRCWLGDKLLLHYIEKDKEFLARHPGALFVVGKQRSKKTSILTTLKLILERQFREKAMEKFATRDKQFPYFRWRGIEETVERCRKNGKFKTLEDMTFFAFYVKRAFEEQNAQRKEFLCSRVLQMYGYDVEELIRYSKLYDLTYDNGTVEFTIWEAIERYSQLYFIYSQPTPLDISNYSIREDFMFKDHGFFPIFDGDPFRSAEESGKYSQYSHIYNGDVFRPGKVFDPKTRYDEAAEFGIGVMQEFAKERKNRYSRSGKANDKEANQDNDLFELDTKMRGHVATIDFFDFWRWLFDDQRPDSLGADNKDLTTICRIKETTDARICLPFFAIEELIYYAVTGVRDGVKYFIRNRKRKETLLVHLMDKLYIPYFHHFDEVQAHYGVHVAKLKTEDGGDGEILGEAEKIYIPVAFTYNGRFATDNWRIFYRMKHRKAKRTLNGIKQYDGIYPSMDEFRGQRSYAVEDMNYAYGDKYKRGS